MKLNERDIRRIIRKSLEEMALKSIRVGMPRELPPGQESEYFETPEQYRVSREEDLAALGKSYEDEGIEWELSRPGEKIWSSEESYEAAMKTWGRESYISYAKRQFERFPPGLNVFVLPQAAKGVPFSRFTYPDDAARNTEGLSIITHHFPDAQIDPDDFNVLVLIPKIAEVGDRSKSPVLPPAEFLSADGIYNTFHALFDGGPLGEICENIRQQVGEVVEMICGHDVYSREAERVLRMGEKSPFAKVFRLKTLRMKKLNDAGEIAPELCAVALIKNTIPINMENFPTQDVNGRIFTPEELNRGTMLLEDIAAALEPAKEAYVDLVGKTIIGSPENVPG